MAKIRGGIIDDNGGAGFVNEQDWLYEWERGVAAGIRCYGRMLVMVMNIGSPTIFVW